MQTKLHPYGQLMITALILISCSFSLQAQFARSPYVRRDPRVDLLVDKQVELNKEALKTRTYIVQGFRILIISTNKRDLALDAKSRLMKNFPEHKSYLFYQSPHFKVHFGNFRTQKEADQVKKILAPLFGEDLLTVPSKVEVRGETADPENV
jgi:hypothetical protein